MSNILRHLKMIAYNKTLNKSPTSNRYIVKLLRKRKSWNDLYLFIILSSIEIELCTTNRKYTHKYTNLLSFIIEICNKHISELVLDPNEC